jgi:hypothetical protein
MVLIRIVQTVRSNEQMMQTMKGATQLLGGMNRSMNLPALQKIAMDFERENDIMDQRQEIFEDATDDMMGMDEEEESDEVVNQVLDEIGVDLGQSVSVLVGIATKQLLMSHSLEKRRLVSVRTLLRRAESRKLLVVEEIQKTTTYKHDSIVCDDEILTCLQERAFFALNELNNTHAVAECRQLLLSPDILHHTMAVTLIVCKSTTF